MTYVIIRDGVVVHCVSVDDLQSLRECYPGCQITLREGNENVGWLYNYDTNTFTAP